MSKILIYHLVFLLALMNPIEKPEINRNQVCNEVHPASTFSDDSSYHYDDDGQERRGNVGNRGNYIQTSKGVISVENQPVIPDHNGQEDSGNNGMPVESSAPNEGDTGAVPMENDTSGGENTTVEPTENGGTDEGNTGVGSIESGVPNGEDTPVVPEESSTPDGGDTGAESTEDGGVDKESTPAGPVESGTPGEEDTKQLPIESGAPNDGDTGAGPIESNVPDGGDTTVVPTESSVPSEGDTGGGSTESGAPNEEGTGAGKIESGVPDEGSTTVDPTENGGAEEGGTKQEPIESGVPNEGDIKQGPTESGRPEEGSTEAGLTESGRPEEGSTEAGPTESGRPEEGSTEAGPTESGTPEEGSTTVDPIESSAPTEGDTKQEPIENETPEKGSVEGNLQEEVQIPEVNHDQEIGENVVLTLENDMVIEENLYLKGGKLDLNGHHLIVAGDFYLLAGRCYVSEGILDVKGDFNWNERLTNKPFAERVLQLNSWNDCVRIKGNMNIDMDHTFEEICSKGKIYIGGNLNVKKGLISPLGGTSENSNSSIIILNGQSDQEINCGVSMLKIKSLVIEGASNRRIDMHIDEATTESKKVKIHEMKIEVPCTIAIDEQIKKSSIYSVEIKEDTTFEGNYFMENIILNGHCMSIRGNLVFGYKLLMEGGKLKVGGNLETSCIEGIMMTKDKDMISVEGDFIFQGTGNCRWEAGTLSVGRNIEQRGRKTKFETGPNVKVILCGNTGDKTCSISGYKIKFGQVILNRDISHYEFVGDVKYTSMEEE